jgi:hypothetical protein
MEERAHGWSEVLSYNSPTETNDIHVIVASSWLIHLNVWRCTDLQTLKKAVSLFLEHYILNKNRKFLKSIQIFEEQ